jgi:hypothetical protein
MDAPRFHDVWTELMRTRGGEQVDSPEKHLFCFATEDETPELIRNWHERIGLRDFFLIGYFRSGDMVCAHPTGKLFVLLHDNFEWWDSALPFEELIRLLNACDEDLEDKVYPPAVQ